MDAINVPAPTNKDTQAYRIASTLMDLLNDGSVPNALWWLDDDTFAADPKYFQTQVLDPYFRGTKYASFLRTMHKMGFARLSRRFDLPKGVVAYACELFRKDKPDLMHKIRMCNSGKQAQALKEAIAKSKPTNSTTATTTPTNESNEKKAPELKAVPSVVTKEASSPVVSKTTKRPDPASVDETIKVMPFVPKAPASMLGPNANAVERYLAVQAQSNARIAMLREQTAFGMDAQRLLFQQQQLQQHQERLVRASLFQQQAPMPNSFLEMALIQEALAKRLAGGPR